MTTPEFEDTQTVVTDELDNEVNDDDNLDVDLPTDDDTDEVPAEGDASAEKPAKATKSTTPRVKAPEGFVKPVEFAKILGEHLGKVVPPQVVYSYIKNNQGEGARHPFPTHEVAGYAWYIKAEEGLAWWDEKNGRVAASKEERAAKAAKKVAAAAETPAEAETAVVEAE